MGPYIKGEVIENIIHYLQTGMPLTPINLPQLKAEGWEVDGKGFV